MLTVIAYLLLDHFKPGFNEWILVLPVITDLAIVDLLTSRRSRND